MKSEKLTKDRIHDRKAIVRGLILICCCWLICAAGQPHSAKAAIRSNGDAAPVVQTKSQDNKKKSALDKRNKRKKMKQKSKPNLRQSSLAPIAPGVWGSGGVLLTIENSGAGIEYECAQAEIKERFVVDEQGRFRLKGVYLRRSPGALRVTLPPKRAAAVFEGDIVADRMKLRVTLTETGEVLDEVVLERGAAPKLRRCY